MADEYIRKVDAINVAQNYHCSHDITIIPNTDYSRGFYDGLAIRENDILQGLSELKPSADVAPVVLGRWIKYTGMGKEQWMCSECSAEEKNPKIARYCYYCGAKMDTQGEE